MCGFFTVLQSSPVIGLDTARRALDSIAHRGPDEAGEWCDRDVFLGHRRLSIIDLRAGTQPMTSVDGRHALVFNGEIYNFGELRDQLSSSGVVFRTRCDTEVILEGFRHWGPAVVEKLNGMFAFVIWDRLRHTAFGARDRLGIKPLCWAMYKGALIVSSTLEPFSVLPGFDQIDPVAVRDLMTFDYIPAPHTIRKGVRKLEPGSRFEWHPGADEPSIVRYWTPPSADDTMVPPTEEELEELLSRSVERQMMSDVPIGVFLSGGIDSSLLVDLMARHSNKPVKTFSVAFSEGGVNEAPIAKRVAEQFGTEHTVLPPENLDAEGLQTLIRSLDEPFCDPALVPLCALSRLTRAQVKVALCGDGADEVFGGYPKYLLGDSVPRQLPFSSLMHRSLNAVPWRPRGMGHLYCRTLSAEQRIRFSYSHYGDFPVFRRDLSQLLSPDFHEGARLEQFFEPWEKHRFKYGTELNADVLMRADLQTYLSENCLVKTDRASMLASLEVRVPYLDEMLLDRILPLPAKKKIVRGELKALLYPIARRLLPREVWDRPKHGFDVPIEQRLSGPWRPVVEDALAWGEQHLPIFDYRYLRRLHRINLKESSIGRELWNPVVLVTWAMSQKIIAS